MLYWTKSSDKICRKGPGNIAYDIIFRNMILRRYESREEYGIDSSTKFGNNNEDRIIYYQIRRETNKQ